MVIHLCASSKTALPAIRKAKRIKCNSSIQSTASWQFLHFMTTLRRRRVRNCVDGWWRPTRATLAQLMLIVLNRTRIYFRIMLLLLTLVELVIWTEVIKSRLLHLIPTVLNIVWLTSSARTLVGALLSLHVLSVQSTKYSGAPESIFRNLLDLVEMSWNGEENDAKRDIKISNV